MRRSGSKTNRAARPGRFSVDKHHAAAAGAQIQRLQAVMRELPQLVLQTSHLFAPGMYSRIVEQPKDAVVVGKKHKAAHFYIVAKGSVAIVSADGTRRTMKAGEVLVSQPGTQRAIVALEDSVYLTVHRTNRTDLDEIEAELIEPDRDALFDARNQLIAGPKAIGGT